MVPNMSSLMSHLHKFAAVGSLSYVDLSRKEVQNGSSLHKSTHLSFHLRRLNLVWASWEANSTAHPFSTRFCAIFWIMALLSLVPAFVHCWKFLPVPSPTMSRNFNMHPDIVIMPVCLTCPSWESLCNFKFLNHRWQRKLELFWSFPEAYCSEAWGELESVPLSWSKFS